jgi:hypothetical protein
MLSPASPSPRIVKQQRPLLSLPACRQFRPDACELFTMKEPHWNTVDLPIQPFVPLRFMHFVCLTIILHHRHYPTAPGCTCLDPCRLAPSISPGNEYSFLFVPVRGGITPPSDVLATRVASAAQVADPDFRCCGDLRSLTRACRLRNEYSFLSFLYIHCAFSAHASRPLHRGTNIRSHSFLFLLQCRAYRVYPCPPPAFPV